MIRRFFLQFTLSFVCAFTWMMPQGYRPPSFWNSARALSSQDRPPLIADRTATMSSPRKIRCNKSETDEIESTNVFETDSDTETHNNETEMINDAGPEADAHLADEDKISTPAVDPNAELKEEIQKLEKAFIDAEKRLVYAKESIKERGKTGYLLLAAEVDNYRKRRNSDRVSMEEMSIANVLKSFVPMLEKFQEAEKVLSPETENEIKFNSNYQSLQRQLETVLAKLGLQDYYGVQGEMFTEKMHEKVGEEHSSLRKGAVLECVEKGMRMKSSIVKKAKVIISLGPVKESADEEEPSE